MSSKTILIIEDDKDLAEFLEGTLGQRNFNIVMAHDLRGAAFKLKNQPYACILLDLRLGEERADQLILDIRRRGDYNNAKTPIILISGNIDGEIVQKYSKDIQGALVKPFDETRLVDMMKKVCP